LEEKKQQQQEYSDELQNFPTNTKKDTKKTRETIIMIMIMVVTMKGWVDW